MLVRISLLGLRRCALRPCTSSQPSFVRVLSTSHARNGHSFVERIRDFVLASEKENFDKEFVDRAHKWDNLNEKEWMLIYRDLGASRSFFMIATLFPAFLIGAAIVIIDFSRNSSSNRMDFVQRIAQDASELGYFIYFPAVLLGLVICLMLRVHHCRLLRIYQNRSDPDQFTAIGSRSIIGQKKIDFNRMECSAFYYAEHQSDGARMALNFLLGNIIVGRKRFMVMDESFRGNNYRTYMLNETSVPPRL